MKYLLAISVWATFTVLPACCLEVDTITIIDANGKRVYVKEQPAKASFLRRRWDAIYKFPRRHPRYWRVGKYTGNVCLWACQVSAAVRK